MLGLLNATAPGSAIGGRSNPMVPSKRVTIHETVEEGEDDTGSERSVQSDESDLFRGVEAPVDGIKSRTAATKLAKINGNKVQSNAIWNVTKQLFASDAANNYYNIVNLNASKRKSFMSARKINSATDSSTSFSEAGKKTLEQLVADALSVAMTPEEMAHHSLSQEHDGSDEKEALYSTTLSTTHEERSVASESSQNESIKTEIVSSPAVVPPAVPPIASFDVCRAQSNLSAASSITAEVALSEEKKVGVKSSIPGSDDPPMAEHPSPVCSPGENNLRYTVDLPGKIELGVSTHVTESKTGNSNECVMKKSTEEDLEASQTKSTDSTACAGNLWELPKINCKPPLADPISQARRVNDVLSGIGSAPKLGKTLKLTRSISPLLFKKNKNETVEANSSKRKNGIPSVRSMSPSLFTSDKINTTSTAKSSSDGSTAESSRSSESSGPRDTPVMEADSRGYVDSSSIEKIAVSKEFKLSQSKLGVLPPRIPSREVSSDLSQKHHARQINTTSADDGSVECSVMKDEREVPSDLPQKHQARQINTTSADDGSVECSVMKDEREVPSDLPQKHQTQQIDTTSADVASVECSVMTDFNKETLHRNDAGTVESSIDALAPIKNKTSAVAKKKSRMEMAREKSAKLQPRSPVRDEVNDAPQLAAPLTEEADNATISSSAGSQKKKEKLKKIMNYRKVAEVAHPIQKSTEGTALKNSENIKDIEIRKSEFSSLPEEDAKKGLRKNVQKSDLTVKKEWSAPVQTVDVNHNALECDDVDDVSLPPELEKDKIKIWQEDPRLQSRSRNGRNTEMMVDAWCGDMNRSDTDVFDTDNNSIIGALDDDVSSKGDEVKGNGVFSCGIEARELKDEIVFEARDLARDVEFGIRQGLRNLFGACDITRDGGVDFLRAKVDATNDQLFGRASVPTRPPMTASNKKNSNSKVLKMSSILDGTDVTRPKNEGKAGNKPCAASNKQILYMEKLKELAMKHA